ncbi:MAG: hypothetical protein COB66_05010 [Coxiella sp. (in: Bacteria)]|nr:MAG: hypothetical protein COB66_05010 [Coxiella sp. (in: g-proteobacteria)]
MPVEMNLNIRYDMSDDIWDKVINKTYPKTQGVKGVDDGIPYWFSTHNDDKFLSASVEPSGLHIKGLMREDEWTIWKRKFKCIATEALRFKVGEIEEGEVSDNIEWLDN